MAVTVSNSRNEPVADRDIVVFPRDENDWGFTTAGHFATGRTGDLGQYQSSPLLGGEFYVAAVDGLENGQASDPEFLATLRQNATQVTLHDGETVNVQFRVGDR